MCICIRFNARVISSVPTSHFIIIPSYYIYVWLVVAGVLSILLFSFALQALHFSIELLNNHIICINL